MAYSARAAALVVEDEEEPSFPSGAGTHSLAETSSQWGSRDEEVAGPVIFHQRDLASVALPVIEDIRRMGKLCDVTVRVGKRHFHCHRLILAATIPYFHAMFTHDMAESKQKEVEVKLPAMLGANPEEVNEDGESSMEALINFAYSGKIGITQTNVQSLLLAASFLQLSSVRDACADFLAKRLSVANVLGVRHFADSLGCCAALVSACNRFICGHFVAVAEESEEFLELPTAEVRQLISLDDLQVPCEEPIFEALLRWVKHSDGREPELPNLLACVRLPLLKPQFISDRVAAEDCVRSSHLCRDLVDEARDYHLMPERRPLLPSFKCRPRVGSRELVGGLIYAVGGQTKAGNSLSAVEIFDPVAGRWKDAEPMATLRSRVGVTVADRMLYAIGGYNGAERLSTVEAYDANRGQWRRVANMNCKRR